VVALLRYFPRLAFTAVFLLLKTSAAIPYRRQIVIAAHAHGAETDRLGLNRDVAVVPLCSAGAQLEARS
jgi:hypothetical protein